MSSKCLTTAACSLLLCCGFANAMPPHKSGDDSEFTRFQKVMVVTWPADAPPFSFSEYSETYFAPQGKTLAIDSVSCEATVGIAGSSAMRFALWATDDSQPRIPLLRRELHQTPWASAGSFTIFNSYDNVALCIGHKCDSLDEETYPGMVVRGNRNGGEGREEELTCTVGGWMY